MIFRDNKEVILKRLKSAKEKFSNLFEFLYGQPEIQEILDAPFTERIDELLKKHSLELLPKIASKKQVDF